MLDPDAPFTMRAYIGIKHLGTVIYDFNFVVYLKLA
jgi:hypothetical protein